MIFFKICHQQAANIIDSDQNFELIFGEINNYHQIGNAYLQYEISIEKDVANAADRVLVDGDVITLVNNAFVYCFKESRLATTGGSDTEHNKYLGQVSTIMRVRQVRMKIYYLTSIKIMNLKLKLIIRHLNIYLLTTMA